MYRKGYLANYFSSEQLKEKYFSAQDSVESRRWQKLVENFLGKKSLLTDRQFQKLIQQLESKPSDGGI